MKYTGDESRSPNPLNGAVERSLPCDIILALDLGEPKLNRLDRQCLVSLSVHGAKGRNNNEPVALNRTGSGRNYPCRTTANGKTLSPEKDKYSERRAYPGMARRPITASQLSFVIQSPDGASMFNRFFSKEPLHGVTDDTVTRPEFRCVRRANSRSKYAVLTQTPQDLQEDKNHL